jgi:hypothetical protein
LSGAQVFVEGGIDEWYWWDPTSALTPDQLNVVRPTGAVVGNWIREIKVVTQTTWAVNATTGSDENPGTVAAPLKTLNELARRFLGRYVAANTDIFLTGTFTDPLAIECMGAPGKAITVHGETPTVTSTGSLTAAFQPLTVAGNLDAEVTDATQTWALRINQRIDMTSGASNGAMAWVMKDLGANKARVSQFVDPTTGNAKTPVNGDTYATKTLVTKVAGYRVRLAGGIHFRAFDLIDHIEDVEHIGQYLVASNMTPLTSDQGHECALVGCKFENAVITASTRQGFTQTHCGWIACLNVAAIALYHSRVCLNGQASTQNFGVNAGSRVDVQAAFVGQGAGVTLFPFSCWSMTIDGGAVAAPTAIYDTAGTACFDMDSGTFVSSALAGNTLMGTGNTSTESLRVRTGGGFYFLTLPVIAGPATDALIGGTPTAWGAVGAGTTVNGAVVAPRL